jgi:vacuolar protein sorting-associated protein 13A/C
MFFDIIDSLSRTYSAPRVYTSSENMPANDSNAAPAVLDRTSLELSVFLPTLNVEIFSKDSDGRKESLSKFVASDCSVKTASMLDGSSKMEFNIKSLQILDTRPNTGTLFKEILKSSHADHRILIVQSYRLPEDPSSTYSVTIDSPKFNLILDHFFAVREFFSVGSSTPIGAVNSGTMDSISKLALEEDDAPPETKYRLNIIDLEISILQNSKLASTEAIVLSSKQLTISRDVIFTFSSLELGMFFCQIDQRAETTLRFIQNFDISLTLDDGNSSPGHKFVTINIDITPMMLRVSYKDMLLILDILKQFNTLSSLSADLAQKADDLAAYNTTTSEYVMTRERVF